MDRFGHKVKSKITIASDSQSLRKKEGLPAHPRISFLIGRRG